MHPIKKAPRNLMQAGFTLIELIVVIVIIGILAAIAIPKFQDLTTDARNNTIKAIAGSLSSGYALAYAKNQISTSFTMPTSCANLATTAFMGSAIDTTTYPVTDSGTWPTGCTVSGPSGTTSVTVTLPR
jgi:MSHA pilin protein MshA